MFLEDIAVNYVAVLVAAIVYFILGAIWYSPQMFGHYTVSHEEAQPVEKRGAKIGSYIGEFIIDLIIAYVLAIFIHMSRAEQIVDGILIAIWIWIGFIATTHLSAVFWGRKTLSHYFVHVSFMFIGLVLMGVIISALSYF